MLVPTSTAFDAIAEEYDAGFTNSAIGRAQRQSVWREMDQCFRTGQRILELNCGTGLDALHLASRGVCVVATDASAKMVEVAERRLKSATHQDSAAFRILSIEEIGRLEWDGLYDGVLSNFAGLNCVMNLRSVASDLARRVRPGGKAILCVFGRCCAWEMIGYTLRGNLAKAFRRLRRLGVVASAGAGREIVVRYPSVGSIRRDFAPHFRLLNWKGVGVAVPPSYFKPWAVRFPRALKLAVWVDPILGRCPGVRALADHALLILERVAP